MFKLIFFLNYFFPFLNMCDLHTSVQQNLVSKTSFTLLEIVTSFRFMVLEPI